MKYLINYIIIVVLLTACSKNNHKEVTVTGRFMQSCDTPAANKNGMIHLSGGGLLNKPSTSLEFTTDENGYFKVTHDKSFSQFSVRTSANHSVLDVTSLGGDEKELGEVYINPFPTNFVIRLDVKNTYTENDTLVLLDFSDPDPFAQLLVSGPFQSGFIDSIKNFNYNIFPLKWSEIMNNGGPRGGVQYRIRSLPDYIGSNQHINFYHSMICSGDFAEVTLVIE